MNICSYWEWVWHVAYVMNWFEHVWCVHVCMSYVQSCVCLIAVFGRWCVRDLALLCGGTNPCYVPFLVFVMRSLQPQTSPLRSEHASLGWAWQGQGKGPTRAQRKGLTRTQGCNVKQQVQCASQPFIVSVHKRNNKMPSIQIIHTLYYMYNKLYHFMLASLMCLFWACLMYRCCEFWMQCF